MLRYIFYTDLFDSIFFFFLVNIKNLKILDFVIKCDNNTNFYQMVKFTVQNLNLACCSL